MARSLTVFVLRAERETLTWAPAHRPYCAEHEPSHFEQLIAGGEVVLAFHVTRTFVARVRVQGLLPQAK